MKHATYDVVQFSGGRGASGLGIVPEYVLSMVQVDTQRALRPPSLKGDGERGEEM
jgi:hypothetical protein